MLTIALPVVSLFSLENDQGIKQWRFIVLRCAIPWIITAVSTAVSTPRLAYASPTLTAPRKWPVCQDTGRRWGCSVSTIGVSPDVSTGCFHRCPALLSIGGSAALMAIALPVVSSFSGSTRIRGVESDKCWDRFNYSPYLVIEH